MDCCSANRRKQASRLTAIPRHFSQLVVLHGPCQPASATVRSPTTAALLLNRPYPSHAKKIYEVKKGRGSTLTNVISSHNCHEVKKVPAAIAHEGRKGGRLGNKRRSPSVAGLSSSHICNVVRVLQTRGCVFGGRETKQEVEYIR